MRLLLCIAAIAALLLSSCSDDPVGTPRTPSPQYSKATLEYYGSQVNSIWGRSAQDLYVAGSVFAHYDGAEWDLIEIPLRVDEIRVIAPGPGETINCLDYGAIHRYDAGEWSRITLPVDPWAYWTSEDGRVYVTAGDRHVWKLEGTAWGEIDSLPDIGVGYYGSLTGDGPDNIFATSSEGAIAHYDGTSWDVVKPSDERGVRSAWKSPGGPLYITTWYDSLYEWNGTELTPVDMGSNFRANWVHGNSPSEVFVGGRYNNSNCNTLRKRTANGWVTLDCNEYYERSVWGAPTGESFVGTRTSLLRIQGNKREVLLGDDSPGDPFGDGSFYDMWGTSEDGIVVVGAKALQYFEGQWTDLDKGALTHEPAYSVWGTSRRDLWAVGPRMILHFDGDRWTWVSGANQKYMRGVWSDSQEAIAVGDAGTIMRSQGDAWGLMPTSTSYDLRAIWGWDGGAFAAGEAGVILRYDGNAWRIEDSPISWTILDLFGLAPDNVWAVGSSALEICHFDGRQWVPQYIPSLSGDLVSVWAGSSFNIFVANNLGTILHYDGKDWSVLPRYSNRARCLWGDSNGDLLVGGSGVLRYQR